MPNGAKNWCFTINNPVEETVPVWDSATMQYMCYKLEVGEKQQTPHFQGYVQFIRRLTFSAVKAYDWLKTAHIEIARKRAEVNRAYCAKPEGRLGDFVEYGEISIQGERTDLKQLGEAVMNRKRSLYDVAVESPDAFIKYPTGIKFLRSLTLAHARGNTYRSPEIYVYFGGSGCGKSRRAHLLDPDLYMVPVHEGGNLWFDGYDGQKTILIDDFNGGIKYTLFLRLLDGYRFSPQTKGGFTTLCAKRIVITSNHAPETWYAYSVQAPAFALLNRLYHRGPSLVLRHDDALTDFVPHPYTLPSQPELIFHG